MGNETEVLEDTYWHVLALAMQPMNDDDPGITHILDLK